ncbi:MAG: GNAT family N-acetyltransferase [Pseudomonadota bacterium]
MRIRDANIADANALTELAFKSKAHWGYSEAFMNACRDELSVTPRDLESAASQCRLCEADNEMVGFYIVHQLSVSEAELDAFYVHPDCIGQGVGKRLMQDAVLLAKAWGHDHLTIQSDPNAEGFYLACGAVRVGEKASDSIAGRFLPLLTLELNRR